MKTPLKKIADIQMGYPFRSGLDRTDNGNVLVIQMKDIDEGSRLQTSDLIPVDLPRLKDGHQVQKGDLLFRSRGRANTAALIDVQLDLAVAAAPLLLLRPNPEKVLPAYLAWYINQPQAQAYLERQASGTISRMINKKAVADMPIDLPPLNRQKQIAALADLAGREQELLRLLAQKRQTYIDGLLMQLALEK